MKPIVIYGEPRTGKTLNQAAFAQHYGAKVGGELTQEPSTIIMERGHLYTSNTPIEGLRNIHISQALKDAGIKPFNHAQ